MIDSGQIPRDLPRASVALIPKRIVHKNRVLAFRAGRQQRDRRADQFFDAADIFDGLGRQIGPGAGAAGRSFQPSMVS